MRELRDWKVLLKHKLHNYIEYQINPIQVLYITVGSVMLFYIDASFQQARPYLIVAYTIFLPIVYFYFKVSPEENVEDLLIYLKNNAQERREYKNYFPEKGYS